MRRQLCLSNLSPEATQLKSKDQLSCADEFSSDGFAQELV